MNKEKEEKVMEVIAIERGTTPTLEESIDYLYGFASEHWSEFIGFVRKVEKFGKAMVQLYDEGVFDRPL